MHHVHCWVLHASIFKNTREVPFMIKTMLNMYWITTFLLFLPLFLSLNVPRFALTHAGDVGCMHHNLTMHMCDVGHMLYWRYNELNLAKNSARNSLNISLKHYIKLNTKKWLLFWSMLATLKRLRLLLQTQVSCKITRTVQGSLTILAYLSLRVL